MESEEIDYAKLIQGEKEESKESASGSFSYIIIVILSNIWWRW